VEAGKGFPTCGRALLPQYLELEVIPVQSRLGFNCFLWPLRAAKIEYHGVRELCLRHAFPAHRKKGRGLQHIRSGKPLRKNHFDARANFGELARASARTSVFPDLDCRPEALPWFRAGPCETTSPLKGRPAHPPSHRSYTAHGGIWARKFALVPAGRGRYPPSGRCYAS